MTENLHEEINNFYDNKLLKSNLTNIVNLAKWKKDNGQEFESTRTNQLIQNATSLIIKLQDPSTQINSEIFLEGKNVVQELIFCLKIENETTLAEQLERELVNLDLFWKKMKATEALTLVD